MKFCLAHKIRYFDQSVRLIEAPFEIDSLNLIAYGLTLKYRV